MQSLSLVSDQVETALDHRALLVFDDRLRVRHVGSESASVLGLPDEPPRGGRSTLGRLLGDAAGLDEAGRMAVHAHCRAVARGAQPGRRSVLHASGEALEMAVRPLGPGRWGAEMRAGLPARVPLLDPVTDLPDRAAMRTHLANILMRRPDRATTALVVFELHGLREIGNVLGSDLADALLAAAAGRLRSAVRGSDMLACVGADRFGLVLTGVADQAATLARAHAIIELLARPFVLCGEMATIDAHAGVALGSSTLRSADEMIRQAQLALAHRSGPATVDGCAVFEVGMDEAARASRALGADLRRALPMGEFRMFYQPQLDLVSMRIVGFEALIRWRHPTRGWVSPGEFIPAAEQLGLIGDIGAWALHTSCAEARNWPSELRVAVNVSPLQFGVGSDLVGTTVEALRRSGLPARQLELEITESAMLASVEAIQTALRALKDLGVRVSMDDFGTGYSSLGQLRSFPFDKLKIDRSFVEELGAREDANAMLRAIAGLAESLGMVVIAEGVETEAQAAAVKRQGCTLIQGYLISRPVPQDDVSALIERYGVCAA